MMQPLDKALRNRLERTIKDARDIAEDAARAALEQLGVGEAAPFAHLSEQYRELRRRLRVHGRQLGDLRHAKTEVQETDRLIEEVAYEHWHRMLFARFLAENNLLMYPDPDDPVAVTLEECEDLAADEGAANSWELAARFAARMLPQIFRIDAPVFQLVLPPEHQQKLERLVADLPLEVFTTSDSLGWVYQFWQAKKKDEVNASEVKIGERELPAVTQLFTEPYMVSFLLDNSLGAWWAARRLTENDLKNAASEEELRRKAAIPGVPLEYLRFVKVPGASISGKNPDQDRLATFWHLAAGTFDGWPKNLSALKTLDPCCGSGHFLVATLLMLVPMRMELEGMTAREAVDAVLRENIYGLELDRRCLELAAFALALAAWKYPGAGGYRVLPELNVACSGLSVSLTRSELVNIANGDLQLRVALTGLHKEFEDAPILGSLIDPLRSTAAKSIQWDELTKAVEKAIQKDRSDEEREAGVTAQGLSKAAQLLAGKYHLVVTNVPYLSRGKQCETLKDFCQKHYPEAKNDLATVFLDRCLELAAPPSPSGQGTGGDSALGGTVSFVLPQNWLFLTSYKKFREKLLKNDTWHLIARLGPGAFETVSGEVVKAILITLSRKKVEDAFGLFTNKRQDAVSSLIHGIDVSEHRSASEKAAQLPTAEIKRVGQTKQLENPDVRVSFDDNASEVLLADKADYGKGSTTGDAPRYLLHFWEFSHILDTHTYWLNSPNGRSPWSGRSQVCKVPLNDVELNSQLGCWLRGQNVFKRNGVVVNKMRQLEPFLYSGSAFDDNICPICPHDESMIPAIWAYVESDEFHSNVRSVDQALKVTAATITKVPFDLARWTQFAAEKYPNGLPKPYSDDPTQWIFHGHPCGSVIWDEDKKWTAHGPQRIEDSVLQVAVARIIGYRWPAELDVSMELANEQREWVNHCEGLLAFSDGDGIVCIPPVRGETPASDRLLNLLAASYGDAWSNDIMAGLLKNADHAGKTLETWLREKFFSQHCKLFQHRPFIWHIWDGLSDGFAALVNYHKIDAKLLETLIYTYIGDWISRQKQDIASGVDGAQERLAAADALKKRLELILEGEAPYDIFVRWKPLDKQPIGWNPDINDGVRLNIRPFLTVPDVGKKGAGILRDKPNINWNKDRGKDVESAPWYHLFKGDRINDHHLTLAEKRTAHEKSGEK